MIAIGTKNKAKTAAVENVMKLYVKDAQFIHLDVESGVSAQPMSNEETRRGAINRAVQARLASNAPFAFGLEGGVELVDGMLYCCNWGAVACADGTILSSGGAQFALPQEVAQKVLQGQELGPVMDDFIRKSNTRQYEGAIGIFTNGLVHRKEMFEQIVTLLAGQLMYAQKI